MCERGARAFSLFEPWTLYETRIGEWHFFGSPNQILKLENRFGGVICVIYVRYVFHLVSHIARIFCDNTSVLARYVFIKRAHFLLEFPYLLLSSYYIRV